MLNFEWMSTHFVSIFLTLAMLTFAYKDNIFFRFAEYTFTGWGIGWSVWVAIDTLYTESINPIFTKPTPSLIIGLILGLMMWTIVIPYRKTQFLLRWPTAVLAGTGLALTVTAEVDANIISQLNRTFTLSISGTSDGISNLILAVMAIVSLMYFFFSSVRGVTERAPMKQFFRFGRWMIMFAIGIYFGSALMGDAIKFIQRINELFVSIGQLFV
jgi:hypothetical protein